MTCRRVYTELYVARNGYDSAILIERSLMFVGFRVVVIDVGATFINFPTFEIVLIVSNGISHIYSVGLFGCIRICAEHNLICAK